MDRYLWPENHTAQINHACLIMNAQFSMQIAFHANLAGISRDAVIKPLPTKTQAVSCPDNFNI